MRIILYKIKIALYYLISFPLIIWVFLIYYKQTKCSFFMSTIHNEVDIIILNYNLLTIFIVFIIIKKKCKIVVSIIYYNILYYDCSFS